MNSKQPTKRLDKIAPTVLNAFHANPPEWAAEFDGWVRTTLGPRPSTITRAAASKQYDAAVLGAIFAFNYFVFGFVEDTSGKATSADTDTPDA